MNEQPSVLPELSVPAVVDPTAVVDPVVVETVVELDTTVVELALSEVTLVELEAVDPPCGVYSQADTQTSAERAPARSHDDPLKTFIDGSITHFG